MRFRPVSVFSASRPCVAKSRLVATSTVPLTRCSGSNSSFSKMRAGKSESKLTIRLDVVERRVAEAIFLGQPAENILLGGRLAALPAVAEQRDAFGIDHGQLLRSNHLVQQLFEFGWLCAGDAHRWGVAGDGAVIRERFRSRPRSRLLPAEW